MKKSRLLRDSRENEVGGFFKKGDSYPHPVKMQVVTTFFELWAESFPKRLLMCAVARATKVSRSTIGKFIREFEEMGEVSGPDEKKMEKLLVGKRKGQ